jgi:hypothetical protein
MALQAISFKKLHDAFSMDDYMEIDLRRKALQQTEFDKAHNQQGYYVILFFWNSPYNNVGTYILDLYHQAYPDSTYSHKDITSDSYLKMVRLLIHIYTDVSDPYIKLDCRDHILLKWLPINVVESNAWKYIDRCGDGFDYDPWQLDINYEKVELIQLKKQMALEHSHFRKTAEHLRSILRTDGDNSLSLMVGLLNPLLHMTDDNDDVGEVLKEVVEMASLLPGVGAEYKQALERFDETK